jgi:hypothetical protein
MSFGLLIVMLGLYVVVPFDDIQVLNIRHHVSFLIVPFSSPGNVLGIRS